MENLGISNIFLHQPYLNMFKDTSKQAISGGLIHILNVVSAILMTSQGQTESTTSTADSCAWYFVTMLFDTSMGSMFNIVFLLTIEKIFTKNKLELL